MNKTICVESALNEALEDVVDCIMTHGQFPRPVKGKSSFYSDFDLYEYLTEQDPEYGVRVLFSGLLRRSEDHLLLVEEERRRLEKELKEYLADKDFVYEVAKGIVEDREYA